MVRPRHTEGKTLATLTQGTDAACSACVGAEVSEPLLSRGRLGLRLLGVVQELGREAGAGTHSDAGTGDGERGKQSESREVHLTLQAP